MPLDRRRWANGFEGDAYAKGNIIMEPEGGDAKIMSNLLSNGNNEKDIEKILRSSGDADNDYIFAIDRHKALAKAVGLPSHSVGYGFHYISEGELPEGIQPGDIIKTIG